MTIGMIYAMTLEIESLLTNENAQPLQTVAGVPFYRIREGVIACAGALLQKMLLFWKDPIDSIRNYS